MGLWSRIKRGVKKGFNAVQKAYRQNNPNAFKTQKRTTNKTQGFSQMRTNPLNKIRNLINQKRNTNTKSRAFNTINRTINKRQENSTRLRERVTYDEKGRREKGGYLTGIRGKERALLTSLKDKALGYTDLKKRRSAMDRITEIAKLSGQKGFNRKITEFYNQMHQEQGGSPDIRASWGDKIAETMKKNREKELVDAYTMEGTDEYGNKLGTLKPTLNLAQEGEQGQIMKTPLEKQAEQVLGIGLSGISSVSSSLTRIPQTMEEVGALMKGKEVVVGDLSNKVKRLNLIKKYGTAGKFARNTKTEKETLTYIEKILAEIKKPKWLAGHIVGMIGTYPFAGFMKQEALQQATKSFESAAWNNDKEGMAKALQLQQEILNPSIWKRILSVIPMSNVAVKVNDYVKASMVQGQINKKRMEDKIAELEGGKTKDDIYKQRNEDYLKTQKILNEEYLQRQRTYLEMKRKYEAGQRDENLKYFIKQQELLLKFKKKQIEQEQEMWKKYNEAKQKEYEDMARSNLQFGLL